MANNVGSALSSLLTTGVTFAAPLDTTVVPQTGTGSATYTRATVATVFDNESVLRNVLSGEARFQGARRVRNLLTNSEVLTGYTKSGLGTITGGVSDPLGGTSAYTFTAGSASEEFYQQVAAVVPIGASMVQSAWIRRRTGTGVIGIATHSGGVFTTVAVTTEWQRLSSAVGVTINTTAVFDIRITTSGDAIDVWHPQCENVTGQSNQAPAEYVSVGVLSTPFHGAGVDGVKYFSTTNGNSVASNVVTEASGSPISASTLLGYLAEGAGTQLVTPTASIRDMTNAAWVKGATMTAALTGTGIDGVANSCSRLTGGAVAATNTAFQTLVAAATSRTYSCYIKRVTGTGTINITQNGGTGYTDITSQINSSTFTRVSLNASVLNAAFGIQIVTSGDVILVDFNQFESGAFATSPMASAGAARNADVLTYPFAGNASASVGSAYAELTTQWANTSTAHSAIDFADRTALYIDNAAATTIRLTDGTNAALKTGLTDMSTGLRKRVSSWGGSGLIVTGDGATVATSTFDGDIGSTAIGVGINAAGASRNWFGTIRNVRIYSAQLSAAQLSAVTA